MLTRSKVQGMLVGGGIGDALGCPVETWTTAQIIEVHGAPVTKYVEPLNHRWFTPETMPAGSTTDDTQLTVATMKGFIDGHQEALKHTCFDPYMDAIAKHHVKAMQVSTAGWGKSTVESIKRLEQGIHWSKSGITTEVNRGTGNGIPMKVAPFALWGQTRFEFLFNSSGKSTNPPTTFRFNQKIVDFAAMTHFNKISAHAGVTHVSALTDCFCGIPDCDYFYDTLIFATKMSKLAFEKFSTFSAYNVSHLNDNKDDLFDRLSLLVEKEIGKNSVEEIIENFGGGSCYVYDSLPFSYAFFLRNLGSWGNGRGTKRN